MLKIYTPEEKAHRALLLRWTLSFALIFPMAAAILFGAGATIIDFQSASHAFNAGIHIARIMVYVGETVFPIMQVLAICVVGHSIFKFGTNGSKWSIATLLISPFFVMPSMILIDWLVIAQGWSNSTLIIFEGYVGQQLFMALGNAFVMSLLGIAFVMICATKSAPPVLKKTTKRKIPRWSELSPGRLRRCVMIYFAIFFGILLVGLMLETIDWTLMVQEEHISLPFWNAVEVYGVPYFMIFVQAAISYLLIDRTLSRLRATAPTE